MSAYSGFASGQNNESDVMSAMQDAGYGMHPAANTDYLPTASKPGFDSVRTDFVPMSSGSEPYMSYDKAKLMSGTQEPEPQPQPGIPSDQYAGLYDGAVDVQYKEKRVVEQRLLEVGHQVIQGVRPIYTYEKIVEVPQVIIKETEREVVKPEIIERILEVPKMEIKERTIVGPPQVFYDEQIVEVPQIVYEERVVHVPRREIQERLFEVQKVEYVYRDEYEDHIEYREVPVDKIIEVPEIEYKVKEVEQLVPQTYVQEYFVDRYKEVPITQVQEVERVEEVPVMVPRSQFGGLQAQMQAQQAQQAQMALAAQQQARSYQVPPSMSMPAPAYASVAVPASQAYASQVVSGPMLSQNVSMAYSAYDPYKAASVFDSMDANRDGVVTKEEYNQFQQEQMMKSMSAAPVGTTFAVPRGTFTPPGSVKSLGTSPMMPQSMMSMQYPPSPPVPYPANPFASASMPGY